MRIAERLAWREELESVKPLPEVEAPVRPKPSVPVDAMIDPQASAGEEPQILIESSEFVARPSKRAKREPRG